VTEELVALKDAYALLEDYSVRRILGATVTACERRRRDAARDGFRTLAERWGRAGALLKENWSLVVGPALYSEPTKAELAVLRVLNRHSLRDLMTGLAQACRERHQHTSASGDHARHWADNARLLASLGNSTEVREAT